jgi:FecR protein
MMARKLIATPIAATLIAAGPAAAQQVGTATAVNPMTESTQPGGATGKLSVGARVMHKERIHTSPSGSAQLLFLDKSSLDIAPNTNLVIDEFVYDPAANRGHMLTRLSQGTLQYIGGQLSHQGAVTITTPEATIGIRGGTATIEHGRNGTRIVNQYGALTIHNGGGTFLVTRPGFVVTIANWNTAPGQPTRVTAAEVNHNINTLSSRSGQNGGVPGLRSLATANLTCGRHATAPCPGTSWLPSNSGENEASQIIIQSTQRATQPITPPPPPPPRITTRGG